MKRYHLLSWLLLLPAAPALAQIEITENDIRNYYTNGATLTTYTAEDISALEGLVNATGPNQTWDFRGPTYSSMEIEEFEFVSPPVPGSDDPHFSTANVILKTYIGEEANPDSVAYAFARLDEDEFSFLGMYASGEFDEETPGIETLIYRYEPAWVQLKLPLQHNSSWTSNTTGAIDLMGFEIEQTIDEEITCNGWGTLITPAGQYPAIRCHETSTLSFMGFSVTLSTVIFHTKSAAGATLDLDEEGNLIGASYTTTSGGGGVDVEQGEQLPTAFTLEQNYPNPFNPSTVIPFHLAESGHVSLKVYDTLGREVSTLLDGFVPAGVHRITWNSGALPSGTYLYRMHAAGQTQIQPLTLSR